MIRHTFPRLLVPLSQNAPTEIFMWETPYTLWDRGLRTTNEDRGERSLIDDGLNHNYAVCTEQWLHVADKARICLPEWRDGRNRRQE